MSVTVAGVVPSGLVALLFTDVEGSTRLWAADSEAMSQSLRLHEVIIRGAVEAHGGVVFATAGDSFAVVFARASEAVDAAVEVQRLLGDAVWGDGPVLRVRMGIHLGECEERDGNYFGPTVNTAARVSACGHGGQVVVTDAVRQSTQVPVVDLGEHELRDVDGVFRLYQVGDGEFPALKASSAASSLPVPRTSLVGREADVGEVRRLLLSCRLVTLTGVGGCGKTRLAIEVAHREIPSAPGGVWFVDLSTVADDDGVTGAFAAALRLAPAAGADVGVEVVRYLAGRDGLLVVDNCEHVLDAAADMIDAILAGSSQMRVIATSRESLEIDGEHPWRVPSLAGGLASPAVQLFSERAVTVGGQVSNDQMAVVAEICERLDGIPLAIELAAARARSMDVVDIRDHLDDRFALLQGGNRRSRQRQQTLEAAVQWSFDLLGPDEQRLLCRLAVFQGGFDVNDVAIVADITPLDAIDLVDSLVAKSLIDITRDSQGVLRHRLLETIRMYAMGRLIDQGDAVTTRDRHLERFLDDPTINDWAAWMTVAGAHRVFREFDNFRAAASWALEHDRPDATVRIACVLYDGLQRRGEHDLALHWLELPATLTPADHITALVVTGEVLRVERFDLAGCAQAALAAIALADGIPYQTLPFAYLNLATTISWAFARPEEVSPALADAYASVGAIAHLPAPADGIFRTKDRIALIERALAIAPNTPSPPTSLVEVYLFRSIFRIYTLDFDGAIADAETAVRVKPDYAFRGMVEAMRACALHFVGRNEQAQHAIEQYAPSPLSSFTYLNTIAAAIVASRQIGPDQAAALLAAEAREYVTRRPNTIGDWLNAFAVLAIERNDMRRALDLAATMSSGPTGVFVRWIAAQAFSNWPGNDLDQQIERFRNAASQPADQVPALLHDRVRLFAEETERWS